MITIFFGPPCVGKGEVIKSLLTDHVGLVNVPMGQILRNLLKLEDTLPQLTGHPRYQQMQQVLGDAEQRAVCEKAVRTGGMVPDEIPAQLAALYMQGFPANSHFIFDGFPRNVVQAQALDSAMAGSTKDIHFMLLTAPEEVLMRRNLHRAANSSKPRDDDDPEVFKNVRLATYTRESRDIIAYYRSSNRSSEVDASGELQMTVYQARCAMFPERGHTFPLLGCLDCGAQIAPTVSTQAVDGRAADALRHAL